MKLYNYLKEIAFSLIAIKCLIVSAGFSDALILAALVAGLAYDKHNARAKQDDKALIFEEIARLSREVSQSIQAFSAKHDETKAYYDAKSEEHRQILQKIQLSGFNKFSKSENPSPSTIGNGENKGKQRLF